MGRGISWKVEKTSELVRACVVSCEEPIKGTDQSCIRFTELLFEKFRPFTSISGFSENSGGQYPKWSKEKIGQLTSNVQKFR